MHEKAEEIGKKKQMSLFDFQQVVEKVDKSTASISGIRLAAFLPVGKLTHNSVILKRFRENGNRIVIETGWGKCEIRGRTLLTQVHFDILDCIMTYKAGMQHLNDDETLVLFSQTRILNEYSAKTGTSKKNTVWLREKIQEIRDTVINPLNESKFRQDYNIVRSIIDASESEYESFGLILDRRYIDFFRKDLTINYDKILPDLLRVKKPVFKSIIRWFLTHKKYCRYSLDVVLRSIAYPMDSAQMLRKLKKELKDEKEVFLRFGIEYDAQSKMFIYHGNESVNFIPSLTAPTPKQKEISEQRTDEDVMDALLRKLASVNEFEKVGGNPRWRKIFKDCVGKNSEGFTILISYLHGDYGIDGKVTSDRKWMAVQRNFKNFFDEKVQRAEEYRAKYEDDGGSVYERLSFPQFCAKIKSEFAGKALVSDVGELGYNRLSTIFVKENGHLRNDFAALDEIPYAESEKILRWLYENPDRIGKVSIASPAQKLAHEVIGKEIMVMNGEGEKTRVAIVDLLEIEKYGYRIMVDYQGYLRALGQGALYSAKEVRKLVAQSAS